MARCAAPSVQVRYSSMSCGGRRRLLAAATSKMAARAILAHLEIDGDEEIRAGTAIAIRGPPGVELYPVGMFDAGGQDAVDEPAPDDVPEVRRDGLELAAPRALALHGNRATFSHQNRATPKHSEYGGDGLWALWAIRRIVHTSTGWRATFARANTDSCAREHRGVALFGARTPVLFSWAPRRAAADGHRARSGWKEWGHGAKEFAPGGQRVRVRRRSPGPMGLTAAGTGRRRRLGCGRRVWAQQRAGPGGGDGLSTSYPSQAPAGPPAGAVASRRGNAPARAWPLASRPFAGAFSSGFHVIPWT